MNALSRLPSRSEIAEVVESVMVTLLSGSSTPESDGLADGPGPSEAWMGAVTVSGPFDGLIVLRGSRAFAQRLFRQLVRPKGGVSDDEARDLFGELTNVLGGNIKALFSASLDATCQLSLPVVTADPPSVHGKQLLDSWFVVGGDRVQLSVFDTGRNDGPGRGGP
ncbi:MAG: chemotaxis protein CheX [Myxococcaceae bacterium]|nr:chemotaxis protein CheX [Myxococcaceae bacterium]